MAVQFASQTKHIHIHIEKIRTHHSLPTNRVIQRAGPKSGLSIHLSWAADCTEKHDHLPAVVVAAAAASTAVPRSRTIIVPRSPANLNLLPSQGCIFTSQSINEAV